VKYASCSGEQLEEVEGCSEGEVTGLSQHACSTEEGGGGRKKMTGCREGKGEGKEMIFLEIFGRNSL